ncbi:MAG TPA: DUF5522 domain-containing protein [Thermoanaerobaculia bacterium]|jgi:hypothetical protein|nr:DUF5522 domain-containing protein [Thermoanaerobaculia bacterium]
MPVLLEGVDFYYEGDFMVFTEKFLRERGYCCESGCRHCPYGFRKERRSDVPADGESEDRDP